MVYRDVAQRYPGLAVHHSSPGEVLIASYVISMMLLVDAFTTGLYYIRPTGWSSWSMVVRLIIGVGKDFQIPLVGWSRFSIQLD